MQKKRKLPEWMSNAHNEVETADEKTNKKQKQVDDAKRALEILEEGLLRNYAKERDDWLLANDDDSDPEDPEAFSLSQSSVVDEMTSEEALAILGGEEAYSFKNDRKQLICDLKRSLSF